MMNSEPTESKVHYIVTVSMSPELAQRARVQAALAGMSRSAYVRNAIEYYMTKAQNTQHKGEQQCEQLTVA